MVSVLIFFSYVHRVRSDNSQPTEIVKITVLTAGEYLIDSREAKCINKLEFIWLSEAARVGPAQLLQCLADRGSIPYRTFPSRHKPRPALEHTQSPTKWTSVVKRPKRENGLHLHLVPALRVCGAIRLLLNILS
jgi:hypothetical protein